MSLAPPGESTAWAGVPQICAHGVIRPGIHQYEKVEKYVGEHTLQFQ